MRPVASVSRISPAAVLLALVLLAAVCCGGPGLGNSVNAEYWY